MPGHRMHAVRRWSVCGAGHRLQSRPRRKLKLSRHPGKKVRLGRSGGSGLVREAHPRLGLLRAVREVRGRREARSASGPESGSHWFRGGLSRRKLRLHRSVSLQHRLLKFRKTSRRRSAREEGAARTGRARARLGSLFRGSRTPARMSQARRRRATKLPVDAGPT